MRILCKSFIVLLALIILVPNLLAQTVDPELYQLSNGIGYNKYLTSTMPNANGEYTLRLESFITASVTTQVIPTDFVIVLDATGSMQWDFTQPGDDIYTKDYITEAENNALPDWQKLRPIAVDDDLGYVSYTRFTWSDDDYGYGFTKGSYMQQAREIEDNQVSPPGFISHASRWFWNNTDKKYYRIHGEHVQGSQYTTASGANAGNTNDWNFYNLYYNRVKADGSSWGRWYFHSNGLTEDGSHINTQQSRPWGTNYSDSIILVVDNDKDKSLIFRPGTRRDVELQRVGELIDQIATENASLTSANKHHLALVSFEGNYEFPLNPTQVSTSSDPKTKVIKQFTAVTNSNKQTLKESITARAHWGGAAYSNHGVHLARLLLEERQQNEAYKPLNASNKVQRNKIVIFFSDGNPSGGSITDIVPPALDDASAIKQPRTTYSGTEINGKIFSIDLANPQKTPRTGAYMEHLSSNYPDGQCTFTQSGNSWNYISYDQTTPTETGYYMSAASMDLQKAFGYTATAATGPRIGSQLVIVDRMSDNFVLPSGDLTGKVKFYTAQCIGTKTISGGGASNPYLAFAAPVQANTRSTLNHLWVSSGSGGSTQWTDVGSRGNKNLEDIDNNITYTVSDDRKTITIKGFKYSDLWCGQDVANDNTRHTVSSSDPNYNNQLYGYRGFKLIAEIPVVLAANAVGGPRLATSDGTVSGVYNSTNGTDPEGSPLVTFPVPELSIPVRLVIQKTGLAAGESASFTLQRRLASGSSSTYTDYATFIITGDGTTNPEVKIMHLDPAYHYRVKETGWSWSYTTDSTVYSTEQGTGMTRVLTNPIVFTNAPDNVTAKRGEDKVTNDFPATTP